MKKLPWLFDRNTDLEQPLSQVELLVKSERNYCEWFIIHNRGQRAGQAYNFSAAIKHILGRNRVLIWRPWETEYLPYRFISLMAIPYYLEEIFYL